MEGMNTATVNRVFTRDKSSNRVHERLHFRDRWFVDERCQTDQSGAFEVLGDAFDQTLEPTDLLCRFCFNRMV